MGLPRLRVAAPIFFWFCVAMTSQLILIDHITGVYFSSSDLALEIFLIFDCFLYLCSACLPLTWPCYLYSHHKTHPGVIDRLRIYGLYRIY